MVRGGHLKTLKYLRFSCDSPSYVVFLVQSEVLVHAMKVNGDCNYSPLILILETGDWSASRLAVYLQKCVIVKTVL